MSLDQIHVDSLMLADAAKVFDGKLYVHGGGWNYLNIIDRDAARPISLAGRVIIPWGLPERDLTFEFNLEHSEAGNLLELALIVKMTLHAQARPDQPTSPETATPFVIDIPGVVFFHPGQYAFVMTYGGKELARTRFQVNFVEPGTPGVESQIAQKENTAES